LKNLRSIRRERALTTVPICPETRECRARAGLIVGAIAALALTGGQALGQEPMAPPEVTASSVFVLNADTGQLLYAKDEDKPFRILSLTKLITAYVLIDRMGDRLSDTVTIDWPHLVRGSSAGLKRGDVWTLKDLLYGMVLVSGNDASVAIADHVGRTLLAQEKKRGDSMKRFVQEMQSAAADLGAKQAKFADPYGLSPANVATARDMGLIAASVFTDPRLLPAWQCTERTVHVEGPHARTVTLKTTIEILGEDGVIGAKTGSHVSKNIYNLVTAWRAPNGETIVGVVLGSASHPARYDDMHAIMAALPHDFPELARPATGAVSNGGGASCH
jgi:serine-type D-Ala-D-Ala carboxypeptidase (penicillin-binding protein 5/6)